jgi:16S rRNA processing protein RimM
LEHAPSDLVVVGRIGDAFGIRGAVRVVPYAKEAAALLEVRQWWIDRRGAFESLEVLGAKVQGEAVVATLTGVVSREGAELLKGTQVWIARSRFPVLAKDEYYWVDLIGLEVVNVDGMALGRVQDLIDNGAHSILEVERVRPAAQASLAGRPLLIPFVERYVRSVERDRSRIVVDWDSDYDQ